MLAQGFRRIVPVGAALAVLLAAACTDSGLPTAAESGATFACPCAEGFECHPTTKVCVAKGTVQLDAAEVQSDGSAAAEVVADAAAEVHSDITADTAADTVQAGVDAEDAADETADAGQDSAQAADSGDVAADGGDGVDSAEVDAAPDACQKADEFCNDKDDNCDGQTDEGCDDDKDLFCDGKVSISGTPLVCPKGGNDCNDAVAAVNPGAPEACDGLDNNCGGGTDEGCGAEACNDKDDDKNGKTDEGCDDDGDQWCDAAMTTEGKPALCPNGGGDCNDVVKTIHPAASEVCDNLDNNCKAGTDDGCDDDKDGYCDKTMQFVGTPAICTKAGSDCDDGAAAGRNSKSTPP